MYPLDWAEIFIRVGCGDRTSKPKQFLDFPVMVKGTALPMFAPGCNFSKLGDSKLHISELTEHPRLEWPDIELGEG